MNFSGALTFPEPIARVEPQDGPQQNRLLIRNARLPDGMTVDLLISGERIASVTPAEPRSAMPAAGPLNLVRSIDGESQLIDVRGSLVLPALVNGHAHLDKTFVGASWQAHLAGDSVAERVLVERRVRGHLAVGVRDRARALVLQMVSFGVGAIRTHVDVDTDIGLAGVEDMLALRGELGALVDLQIIAFPQSGIVSSPGVEQLLGQALVLGADGVGGLDPIGFDHDSQQHLRAVFTLAQSHGVAVDIHLHDLGAVALEQIEQICRWTVDTGLGGEVAISHAYGLGSVPVESARRAGGLMAAAGVAVMTNGPAGPMPPVLLLRDEGVTVFSGSDNIRDAWWPYGNGDPLDVARTVAYQSNFRTDEELAVALDLVTDSAARALGVADYGIAVGHRADLLLVPDSTAVSAVASPPVSRTVIRAGRVVSSTVLTTQYFS